MSHKLHSARSIYAAWERCQVKAVRTMFSAVWLGGLRDGPLYGLSGPLFLRLWPSCCLSRSEG